HSPAAVRRDLHPRCRITAAGRCQHALAFNLDHARAAVAVRAHPLLEAEVRNFDPDPFRRLQQRLAVAGFDGLAVQGERDRHYLISCGKNLSTDSAGFGAAWPSPQIDASTIACDSSLSSG